MIYIASGGIQDPSSKFYTKVPETDFSTKNTNQKILTTLVAQSGELVTDIRIGKKSDTGAACRNGGINMQNDMHSTAVLRYSQGTRRAWVRLG